MFKQCGQKSGKIRLLIIFYAFPYACF